MEENDPEIIAKNECVGALFAPVTGRDPFLNDSLRSAIDLVLAGDRGAPASLDLFMRKAVELASRRGAPGESFSMFHVNLRARSYEPLWLRSELIDGLKPMTGCRQSMLVVSGLREAVQRGLPRSRRRISAPAAMAEARRYIDALGSRFAAKGCKLTIMYLD